MAALWVCVEAIEDGAEDAVGRLVLVGLKPGPDEVGQVAIRTHCAASRAVERASASNAFRSPRIA